MSKEKLMNVVPILTLILGTLIGSGVIWSWKSSQMELERLQIEKAKASIELRDKKSDLLMDIVIFQSDWKKRKSNYAEYRSKIDDYNAIEKNLALLESRESKIVDFEQLLPDSPKSFNIMKLP